MEFIKTFERKIGGRVKENGSLIICDGELRIKINEPNCAIDEYGVVDGGIGVVIKKQNHKTLYLKHIVEYNAEDIPINLQGEKYRFKIPAEKLSDTEYVFMFNKAVMLNKK